MTRVRRPPAAEDGSAISTAGPSRLARVTKHDAIQPLTMLRTPPLLPLPPTPSPLLLPPPRSATLCWPTDVAMPTHASPMWEVVQQSILAAMKTAKKLNPDLALPSDEFERKHGRSPTFEELAKMFGTAPEALCNEMMEGAMAEENSGMEGLSEYGDKWKGKGRSGDVNRVESEQLASVSLQYSSSCSSKVDDADIQHTSPKPIGCTKGATKDKGKGRSGDKKQDGAQRPVSLADRYRSWCIGGTGASNVQQMPAKVNGSMKGVDESRTKSKSDDKMQEDDEELAPLPDPYRSWCDGESSKAMATDMVCLRLESIQYEKERQRLQLETKRLERLIEKEKEKFERQSDSNNHSQLENERETLLKEQQLLRLQIAEREQENLFIEGQHLLLETERCKTTLLEDERHKNDLLDDKRYKKFNARSQLLMRLSQEFDLLAKRMLHRSEEMLCQADEDDCGDVLHKFQVYTGLAKEFRVMQVAIGEMALQFLDEFQGIPKPPPKPKLLPRSFTRPLQHPDP